MGDRVSARLMQYAFMLVALATPASAVVSVDVGDGVVDSIGKVFIEVRMNGENVGGVQNDIFFDNTIVQLQSAARCRINPAIGDRAPGCAEDPVRSPCKTFLRHLIACDNVPWIPGCEGQIGTTSRFRGIIAPTVVPNSNLIPDGTLLYTCEFDVLDRGRLPLWLVNTNVIAAEPSGARLESTGRSGFIAADERRTPPATATVTATPTPAPPPATLPPSLELGSYAENRSTEVLVVLLHSGGRAVASVQSDIWLDGRVVELDPDLGCQIQPTIGSEEPGCTEDPATRPCKTLTFQLESCAVEPSPPGCEGQLPEVQRLRTIVASTSIESRAPIDDEAQLYICRLRFVGPTHATEIRLGNTVASDPFGNGVDLDTKNAIVRFLDRVPETPVRPIGYNCDKPQQCDSGFCVDGTCCASASCSPDQFCNISTAPGGCSPRSGPAACCNLDEDCATGNCAPDHPDHPAGCFGGCGAVRTPTPGFGDPSCTGDGDCQPGFKCNVREGRLCCEQAECAPGSSCRVPGSEGFCRPLPTPTRTRVPNAAACSPNRPEVCASGHCVNDTCCADPSCPVGERCDIFGLEGRCLPPLQTDEACEKNTDCLPGLQCRNDDGQRFRCTPRQPTPTHVPTLRPTATVGATIPDFRNRDDSGCSITPSGSADWLPWPLALLLLGRSRRTMSWWPTVRRSLGP